MGQAVKYALLAVALIAVIGTFVVFLAEIPVTDTAAQFAVATTDIINICGGALSQGRSLVNLICGTSIVPEICIFVCLMKPFYILTVRIVVAVNRWINQ